MSNYALTEIDRELFVSLNRQGDKSPYGNRYIILLDQNFKETFFAPSDEKAKEIFRNNISK